MRRPFRPLATAFTLSLLTGFTSVAEAATSASFWSAPVIAGYGRIHDVADDGCQQRAEHTCRIVFPLTPSSAPDTVNAKLDHVARDVPMPLSALTAIAPPAQDGLSDLQF